MEGKDRVVDAVLKEGAQACQDYDDSPYRVLPSEAQVAPASGRRRISTP
jgi:hypothetical protein